MSHSGAQKSEVFKSIEKQYRHQQNMFSQITHLNVNQ